MTDKVVVTQADRDAAAERIAVWGDVGAAMEAHKVRQGECDDHGLVQAFARHRTDRDEALSRLEAEKRELVEALEKIDREVSHGKMGDWSLALRSIRETCRSTLSKLNGDQA